MRRTIGSILLMLAVTLFDANAQQAESAEPSKQMLQSNTDIKGVWELKQTRSANGDLLDVPLGLYKIYDSDGSFSNMRLTKLGAVLSHHGKYEITPSGEYFEIVNQSNQTGISPVKQTGLQYKLSADKDSLTISGELKLNNPGSRFLLYEVWKRVKVYAPNNS